jgi:hypothetical protein
MFSRRLIEAPKLERTVPDDEFSKAANTVLDARTRLA